jgi:hypothetical protein
MLQLRTENVKSKKKLSFICHHSWLIRIFLAPSGIKPARLTTIVMTAISAIVVNGGNMTHT